MYTTRRPRSHLLHLVVCCLLLLPLAWQVAALQQGEIRWEKKVHWPALDRNLLGDPAERPYGIYLPPSYESGDKRYPVIYVLHGYTQNHRSVVDKPALDREINARAVGEVIVVFVDGSNKLRGSLYRSSEVIGDYEKYIAAELVDHIDANYRTIADRASRGITGYSMGGYGAMHLALKFPETFSAVVSQAGCYDYDTDWFRNKTKLAAQANPVDWAAFRQVRAGVAAFALAAAVAPAPERPPFFLDLPFEVVDGEPEIIPEVWQLHVDAGIAQGDLGPYLDQPTRLSGVVLIHGRRDNTVPVEQARNLDQALTDAGVEHVYDEHGGGHTFSTTKSLRFFNEHLEGLELL